jgi:hypothetical protein
MIEKPPLKLLKDPTLFVGPHAWAVMGAREVWSRLYEAVKSESDPAEVLFDSWPELIAFDLVSNYFIEQDRAQGGVAWARRVAWWDNTMAQRQQIVAAYSNVYEKARERLGREENV